MLNNKIIGLITLSLFTILANSQVQNFVFKVEKPNRFQFDSLLYEGIIYEFECKRIFFKDSSFCEINILNKLDTFRIQNGNWFIRVKNRWKPFCSIKNFKTPMKPIKWNNSFLIPRTIVSENGEQFLTYYLSDKEKIENTICNIYKIIYFSTTMGIVKIDFQTFRLVRQVSPPN